MRAQQEILREGRTRTLGATQSGSGGGVRITAKIRHQKLAAYGQSSNPGGLGADWGVGVGGVPMRLSATEVEGGDSDDDEYQYPRPNSSRNSFASGNRQYRASGRFSRDGTPPSGGTSARNSLAELAEAGETPLASQQNSSNYFPTQPTAAPPPPPGSAGQVGRTPTTRSAGSGGSGSSGERADAVPDLDAARVASNQLMSGMASQSNTGKLQRQPSSRNLEDLKRRGSVDERTATMSMKGLGAAGTGRLFIANPDLDSD